MTLLVFRVSAGSRRSLVIPRDRAHVPTKQEVAQLIWMRKDPGKGCYLGVHAG